MKSAKESATEASEVETLSGEDAVKLVGAPGVVFVDVREGAELRKTGQLQDALHVPHGLLKSQADPSSPTHNPDLGAAEKLVLYCASGIRSAIGAQTLQTVGVRNVAHVAGGFRALQKAGARTQELR